jgi:hypothetical protein
MEITFKANKKRQFQSTMDNLRILPELNRGGMYGYRDSSSSDYTIATIPDEWFNRLTREQRSSLTDI